VKFTVWETATGTILRSGFSFDPNVNDGETLFLGEAYSADCYRFDPATFEPIAAVRQLTQQELAVEINRERGRRIEAGTMVNGVQVTGRDEDIRNLTNLALGAQLRLAAGDSTTVTLFRDGANVDHEFTPAQLIALWQQSSAYVSALYSASWVLKAMEPIPSDVSNDEYWPAVAG
jgi:hypothetical protein